MLRPETGLGVADGTDADAVTVAGVPCVALTAPNLSPLEVASF